MTTMTDQDVATTQVFRVFIKATPQAIWEAITDPEWNVRYGYQSRAEYDLRPGGAYRAFANAEMVCHGAPEVVIEGEVLEIDPPHRLVQTWHAYFSPETTAEGPTRLTWELAPTGDEGVTQLTVTHELADAPNTAAIVTGSLPEAGGGWSMVISDLKTLLETGASFSAG
jgi:uncharacterized protein YndB with AHSA1/START domain